MGSKIGMVISEVINSNAAVNTFLGVSFGTLALRSHYQQKRIDCLEEEKNALIHSNKSMKTMMWEWKQQLYAEASVVPLARLKQIYGELAPAALSGDIAQQVSAPKITV